jgi:exoribonuclease-2
LAAPFKPKDAQLFAIISAFDAAYSAYNGYQAGMERFWTLQYLKQEGISVLEATLFKEAAGGAWLVRADHLPLVLSVVGAQALSRGDKVRVQLGAIDAIALDVHGTVIEKISHDNAPEQSDEGPQDSDDDASAGPIAIALDLNDSGADAA